MELPITIQQKKRYKYDQDRAKDAEQRRKRALEEIHEQRGFEGITGLLEGFRPAWIVGRVLPLTKIPLSDIVQYVSELRQKPAGSEENLVDAENVQHLIKALTLHEAFLHSLIVRLDVAERLEVLLICPFDQITWTKVAELSDKEQTLYWTKVQPLSEILPKAQLKFAVDRLLSVKRPDTVLKLVEFDFKRLSSRKLYQILECCNENNVNIKDKDENEFLLRRIFKILSTRSDIDMQRLATLELKFLDVLDTDGRDTLNIELLIESNPNFFVHAVVKANSSSERNADIQSPSSTRLAAMQSSQATKFLQMLRRIPGRDGFGNLDYDNMLEWIKRVRAKCLRFSCEDCCEREIGRLLSNASVGRDDIWPEHPVREVLERVLTRRMKAKIVSSLYLESFNRNAAVSGGEQDKLEAQKFEEQANKLRYSHTNVAAIHDEVARMLRDLARDEEDKAKTWNRMR